MPTIREAIEDLPALRDKNPKLLKVLVSKFSSTSLNELSRYVTFQPNNVTEDDFFAGQDKLIIKCANIEASSFGADVRKAEGLEPFDLDAEIESEAEDE